MNNWALGLEIYRGAVLYSPLSFMLIFCVIHITLSFEYLINSLY